MIFGCVAKKGPVVLINRPGPPLTHDKLAILPNLPFIAVQTGDQIKAIGARLHCRFGNDLVIGLEFLLRQDILVPCPDGAKVAAKADKHTGVLKGRGSEGVQM